MARPLRLEFEGAIYHVTSRGNAKQEIFADDEDRQTFLMHLARAVRRFSWICHAFCLMGDHYHLLIETPSANLSRGMQYLNSAYTQAFNRRHGRSGHVLQGRYKAVLVEKESHLLELTRYLVLNPVRAGLVRRPEEWPWSSYSATVGLADVPDFLHTDWILSNFHDDKSCAKEAYREFVGQGCATNPWDELQGGVLLGSERFARAMKPLISGRSSVGEIPRRERFASRPALEELFSGINDIRARNERIYRAVYDHQYPLAQVARHLGLHYSTVSAIVKDIERTRGEETGE